MSSIAAFIKEKTGDRRGLVDYSLLFIVLFLLSFGLVMLYSTSSYEALAQNGDAAYYLKRQLTTDNVGKNATLFENVMVSGDVLTDGVGKTVDSKTEDGATKTVITYTYKYDGYTFNVEAEAQSVQTHFAADAMKSVWGVNATVSGDSIIAVN